MTLWGSIRPGGEDPLGGFMLMLALAFNDLRDAGSMRAEADRHSDKDNDEFFTMFNRVLKHLILGFNLDRRERSDHQA